MVSPFLSGRLRPGGRKANDSHADRSRLACRFATRPCRPGCLEFDSIKSVPRACFARLRVWQISDLLGEPVAPISSWLAVCGHDLTSILHLLAWTRRAEPLRIACFRGRTPVQLVVFHVLSHCGRPGAVAMALGSDDSSRAYQSSSSAFPSGPPDLRGLHSEFYYLGCTAVRTPGQLRLAKSSQLKHRAKP